MQRSHLSLAACAATLVLGLAACSSSSAAEDEPSTADDGAAASAQTVTISDTLLGDVEVPASPERVVGLWNVEYQLDELGVIPVGVLEGSYLEEEIGAERYAELSQLPTVGALDGLDVEAIIELEPDLIISMDNGTEWDYDELSAIAPTVVFAVGGPSDVWDNYEGVAAAVGKSAEYDALATSFDEALVAVDTEHGEDLDGVQAILVDAYQEGSASLYTTRALAAGRIEAAGFSYDTSWDDQTDWWNYDLDFELLDELNDEDVLFYTANPDGSAYDEYTQALLDEPAFTALPAVQAGHLYPYRSLFVYTFEAALQQAEDLAAAADDYSSGS